MYKSLLVVSHSHGLSHWSLFLVIIILSCKLELLKADPQDNIPADKSHAAGSEASVECHHSFMLGSLTCTVQNTGVSASGSIHEPETKPQ